MKTQQIYTGYMASVWSIGDEVTIELTDKPELISLENKATHTIVLTPQENVKLGNELGPYDHTRKIKLINNIEIVKA